MPPTKRERFDEFLRRMQMARAAQNDHEALQLIAAVLDAVEDEMSGVPRNPEAWQTDGRMYPPQADAERRSPSPGVRMFRSRGHRTYLGSNGSILIATLDGGCVFEKAGADGALLPGGFRP